MPCPHCQRPLFHDGVENEQQVCEPCRKTAMLRLMTLWILGTRWRTVRHIPRVNQNATV